MKQTSSPHRQRYSMAMVSLVFLQRCSNRVLAFGTHRSPQRLLRPLLINPSLKRNRYHPYLFSTLPSPCDDCLDHEEHVAGEKFQVTSPYHPSGDQPQAIDKLVEQVRRGDRFSVLRGITGTGKTHVMAHTIARLGRPTLVLCHNKTLAAQLCRELQSNLSNNHVELFISYYDLFMPESYNETKDKYRAKKTKINRQTNQLRHKATRALVEHSDVVIVASISCIFGMGMPSAYLDARIKWTAGETIIDSIDTIMGALKDAAYTCIEFNDDDSTDEVSPGQFSVSEYATGARLSVWPPSEPNRIRVDFTSQDDGFYKIVAISNDQYPTITPIPSITIFPAKHHVFSSEDAFEETLRRIECELQDQVNEFKSQNKLKEVEILTRRVSQDLFALRERRTCQGIENYSRHLALREAGEPPETLLDYFNNDKWLLIVDESHAALPQIRMMHEADGSRKLKLVKHGFRLPSALDNRPLRAEEFWQRVSQAIFVSATPSNHELSLIDGINDPIDMVIRPTYVCDPTIQVLPKHNQLDVLVQEIKDRASRQERTLAIAYTKRDAEDLASYLLENGVNTTYIHSGVKTHERSLALQSLQRGEIDCLVGVNLLREGLDLPQVSLVAIFHADTEGFLRSETMLLQTIGRAARNINGTAILFANRITDSMRNCIDTTHHRRQLQLDYNTKHGKTMKSAEASSTVSIFELEKEKQDAQGTYDDIPWETSSINRGRVDKMMKAEQKQEKRIIDIKDGIIIDHIPSKPGVYMWQDAASEILYIGKAKKLRTRVKSYLSSNANHGARIQAMIKRAVRVEIILTPSDRDALLLESNMIKHYQPPYNVMLKDDDSYPYICASIGDEYPRFMIAPGRQKGDDATTYKYFGPYPHYSEINSILQGIEEKYDLRSKSFQARYGEVSKEVYQELFQTALSEVFETKGNPLDSSLPALRLKFEEGSHLFESEYNKCRDVVAIGQHGDDKSIYVVHVLQLREGIIAGQFSYTFEWEPGLKTEQDFGDAIQTILEQQHYPSGERAASGRFSFFPDEILTEYPLIDTKALKETVILARDAAEPDQQRYKVTIRTAARRGSRREADERALKCAIDNAAQKAREQATNKGEKRFGDGKAAIELALLLSLPKPPDRIECYDISHTQGESTVGSRVVFLNGQPAPHLYRRFIVRNVVGVDDYASLEEVLERRFRNVWLKGDDKLVDKSDPWAMPDLVVIDGGKGQLSSAIKGMGMAHVYPATMDHPDANGDENLAMKLNAGSKGRQAFVPVIALAKNKEEVFCVDKSDPVNENPDSAALLLLRSIRDESHRFALRFHRLRRSRADGLSAKVK